MQTLSPPSTRTTTAVLAASHVGVDLTIGAMAGLLPSIRSDLSLTGAQVALVATVLAVFSSFGQPVAGLVIDRLGPRHLAIGSAIATSVVLGSVPLISSFALLVVIAIAGGLAAAVYHPATAALVRSAADHRSAASNLGLFAAGGTVGLAIGPSLATTTVSHSALLASLVLALPGAAMAIAVAFTLKRLPISDPLHASATDHGPAVSERARVPVATLIAAMTAVYVASITIGTAVPLWLADRGVENTIGPTLGAFSLAAAAGGIIGGRIASTRHPLAAAHVTLAAPFAFLALGRITPGSLGWYAVVAAGGALAHLTVPVAIDAAQELLHRAVAAASGLVMGLPIGLASLIYLAISISVDPIDLGHVVITATAATAVAAAFAHLAFAPARTPRPIRTPACTCAGGALAMAAC